MDASQSLVRGLKHHRTGNFQRAEQIYRDILRIDPAHADASHLLGVVSKQLAELPSHASPRVSTTASLDQQALCEKQKYETVWQHAQYREFSPGMRGADVVGLIDLFRVYGVKTILDAGCGSGKLMRRLMEAADGPFDVHGFDISENCLDPYFDEIRHEVLTVGCLWNLADFGRSFDAVICTDVLEHIPTDRVPAVLENLRGCTKVVGYLGIALFHDGFGPQLLGRPLHLTVKEPAWWIAEIERAGFTIVKQMVEASQQGQNMWLHVLVKATADSQ